MKDTLQSPDRTLWVELDATQIVPDDPGQGTPVLVCLKSGETASWNCATCEGAVDDTPLNDRQLAWLESVTPKVEAWMSRYGV